MVILRGRGVFLPDDSDALPMFDDAIQRSLLLFLDAAEAFAFGKFCPRSSQVHRAGASWPSAPSSAGGAFRQESIRFVLSDDEAENTSSGASIVDVDFVVGRTDSNVAVATLDTVEIVALGYSKEVNMLNFDVTMIKADLFGYEVGVTQSIQLAADVFAESADVVVFLQFSVAIINSSSFCPTCNIVGFIYLCQRL